MPGRRRAAAVRIQRAMRQKLMTMRRRKNVRSGQGITTQHDSKRIYVKKTMPSSKKKGWKSFVRKVHAVSEKELGARQVIFNKSVYRENYTQNEHIESGYVLYGQSSTSSHYNDLKQISGLENVSFSDSRTSGQSTYDSTKFMFQSGILDMTVRNTSTFRESDADKPNAYAKMEIDVYEMTIGKNAEDGSVGLVDVGALFAQNKTFTEKLANGSAEIEHTSRGSTPFDFSYTLGKFGVKILKKTKYMVPNGETFTYQVRDPKRRSITQQDIESQIGFNRPGWTRVVWLIAKLVPGCTLGNTNGTYKESITVGVTRKYFYKLEGSNEDRTSYEANT